MTTDDYNLLTAEEKLKVDTYIKKINLDDKDLIISFAAVPQNKVGDISKKIYDFSNKNDYSKIINTLKEFTEAVSSFNVQPQKGFFKFLNKNHKKELDYINNYTNHTESELIEHNRAVTKDTIMLNILSKENKDNLQKLNLFIIAGTMKIKELEQNNMINHNNFDAFQRKIQDLKTTQLISRQLFAQIDLLNNSSNDIKDRIQNVLNNMVPLARQFK